jgi:hypothetical protein
MQLPTALIASPIGVLASHSDYEKAKSGNPMAAASAVRDVMGEDFLDKLRCLADGKDVIVQPVLAIEATGRNKLPLAAAALIAEAADLRTACDLVQATRPKRTALGGLERVFARPRFDGPVEPGVAYLLVDDTLTQGGTLAALAAHIERGGGQVIGLVTLTGKMYSATIALSSFTLEQIYEKFGDLEAQFRDATGYGYAALTESEARYLAGYRPVDAVRDRIIEAGEQARYGAAARSV